MEIFSDALIVDMERKQILLQHRDDNAPTDTSLWGIWGGSLDDGETPAQAMARELQEELLLDVGESDLIFYKTFEPEFFFDCGANRNCRAHVFILHHKPEYTYDQQEGDYMQWFDFENIPKEGISPIAKCMLEDFVTSLK